MLLWKLRAGYFIRTADVEKNNGHAVDLYYKECNGVVYRVHQTGAVLVRGESTEGIRRCERVIRVNHFQ